MSDDEPGPGQVPDGHPDADLGDEEPEERRRLSVTRVCMAIVLVVAGIGVVGYRVNRSVAHAAGPAVSAAPVFAPYVDATLPPYYQFQDPSLNPSSQVILGFIVSDPTAACTPSWGGFFTQQQAAETLSLDRRIAELRSEGGDAVVSFGGAANREMALGCSQVSRLQVAYQSVISRYRLTTVDFDLEGAALGDAPSISRRATALAAIQHAAQAAGRHLAIWLTLPVGPDGLQADAENVVRQTLRAGVDLAGVNLMTMDFGLPEANMLATAEQALAQAHNQMATMYRAQGTTLPVGSGWHKIGVTAMIGQNDSQGEVFTTDDAKALISFAKTWNLGRVSIWSLNRDAQCGAASFSYAGVHSNTCSGVIEAGTEFSDIMSKLPGSLTAGAGQMTSSSTLPVLGADPPNSPFPTWLPWPTYTDGYRVERDGDIYQAKWYNQGVDPTAVMASTDLSPWQLIGPVLPTDRAPTTTTLPAGIYPTWSPSTAYQTGAIVLYDGLPYEARWLTMAASPAAASLDASASSWHPLFSFPGEPTPTP